MQSYTKMQSYDKMPNSQLSIYIPHVLSSWASPQQISAIFYRLNIGVVRRVDFLKNKGGSYQAHVYFAYWFNNTIAYNLQAQILNPQKEAKVVYDDPCYWRVLPNQRPAALSVADTYGRAYSEAYGRAYSRAPAPAPAEEKCTECADPHLGSCKNENYYEGQRYFEQYCI